MTTVYALTRDDGECGWVSGIYSSLEKFEAAKKLLPHTGTYEPEEFVLDRDVDLAAAGRLKYRVQLYKDGGLKDIDFYGDGLLLPEPPYEIASFYMVLWCYASGWEEAVKIANERRAQLIASGEWDRQAKA